MKFIIRWGANKHFYNARKILRGNTTGEAKKIFIMLIIFIMLKNYRTAIRGESKMKFIVLKYF